MPVEVLMPALSPTMTEGKLARWLKAEGDDITAGDVIAEIETDKATMEVEAVDEGKLGKILVAEGAEGVAVNTPIAVIFGEEKTRTPSLQPRPHPSKRLLRQQRRLQATPRCCAYRHPALGRYRIGTARLS